MREGHGVGLVAHAQALPTVLPGVLERVANDALHALSGVDVLLNGNFVGGVLLEDPANTDIQAFGVLPENDQADVFLGAAAKRRESLVKQLHGPRVDVEVQLESQRSEERRVGKERRYGKWEAVNREQ